MGRGEPQTALRLTSPPTLWELQSRHCPPGSPHWAGMARTSCPQPAWPLTGVPRRVRPSFPKGKPSRAPPGLTSRGNSVMNPRSQHPTSTVVHSARGQSCVTYLSPLPRVCPSPQPSIQAYFDLCVVLIPGLSPEVLARGTGGSEEERHCRGQRGSGAKEAWGYHGARLFSEARG